MSYQLKVSKKSHGTYVSILQNGKEIEPLSDLYATKDEALQIGKLLELANDCAAATRQAEEQAKRLEVGRQRVTKFMGGFEVDSQGRFVIRVTQAEYDALCDWWMEETAAKSVTNPAQPDAHQDGTK